MFDPTSPEHWRDLRPGSSIALKDKQALQDSMEAGLGFNPLTYSVDEARSVVEQHGLGEWTILHMVDPRPTKQDTWFVTLAVDNKLDTRVYFQPDDAFVPGTRKEIVQRDNGADAWLFQEPPDLHNYRYTDLLFTTQITYGGVAYVAKGPTLWGNSTVRPAQTGLPETILAGVTEYVAQGEAENPELMILELGGVNPDDPSGSDEGGLLRLLLGAPVAANDYEVLPG